MTTDGNGASLGQLAGPLPVVVKKAGFKAATLDEIKLDVQQIRAVDVKLDVGQSTETVSVNASGAATIETVSSTVSQTIENKRVVDLPLNGRNPFSLATLSPGVIPAWLAVHQRRSQRQRAKWRMAALRTSTPRTTSRFSTSTTPSVDAVQEFSVQTNSVSAEFGRLGGGVINLVTRAARTRFITRPSSSCATARSTPTTSSATAPTSRGQLQAQSVRRQHRRAHPQGPRVLLLQLRGLRQGAASVGTFTVPLPEWRQGDFRNLKNAAGQPIIIYDPLTTRPDPANGALHPRSNFVQRHVERDLPEPDQRDRAQPDAIWPLPNTTPINANTQQNNFTAVGTNINNSNRSIRAWITTSARTGERSRALFAVQEREPPRSTITATWPRRTTPGL